MLHIDHATVYTPEQCIEDGTVLIDGPTVVEVGPSEEFGCPDGAESLDATGLLMAPGFIDLQVNGLFGYDFGADPASIWPASSKLPRFGVTSFLPTITTSPLETVAVAQEAVLRPERVDLGCATPLGLHVEGPFLNPEKRGAHNKDWLRSPDLDAVKGWSPERGVRLVTLAPELPGALVMIAALVERGVVVSAGHSAATFDQALSGIEAGIRYGTHLFNAMASLHHRAPGLVGALLTDPRTVVGLIGDGAHTHPALIQLVWRALDHGRLNLVSDAVASLGSPSGLYQRGSDRILVDECSVRLADGTLVGSAVALDQALRNLVAWTACSLEEALATITSTPADLLGLGAERGRIAPGRVADLVLLTRDLVVDSTLVGGKVVYRATPAISR